MRANMTGEQKAEFRGTIAMQGGQWIRLLVKAMRPIEWFKNGFVFAPLFFSGQASDIAKLAVVSLVAVSFSGVASAIYIFNDINDRALDRLHPIKRLRPIASGRLSIRVASIAAVLLAAGSVLLMAPHPAVCGLLLGYGLINVLYSLWLKHMVIVDIFCIAAGFVVRVFAGGLAIGVIPSAWLVLATFLLSLFLALAKRRHELLVTESASGAHRPVLEQYSLKLVDELISVVTPVTLITYVLYTLDPLTVARFRSGNLYLTAVFVVFGIFRYLFLVHRKNLGGAPAEVLVNDIPLLAAVAGWILSFALIVYHA